MKKLLLFFLLLTFATMSAQKVEVSGIARGQKTSGHVMIVLNDTLNKLPKNLPDSLRAKIWDNKEVIGHSDENGRFSFKANLEDTLVFSDFNHITRSVKVSEIYANNNSFEIILEPIPCVPYNPCTETFSEFYIFIGSKVNVQVASEPNYCNVVSSSIKYHAKYKILKKYSPNINFESIDFFSYDHALKIKFDEYENLLLVTAKYCGDLIRQRNNTYPVYRTKDGKWATPPVKDYSPDRRISTKEPRKLKMAEPIVIPAYFSGSNIENVYKAPYFEIREGKVYMLYGYYPEDLLDEIAKKL